MTTPMTDEQRRIKSYLTAQAAKLEPAAIVAKVRDAMAELEAAAVALPASRFSERPAPDLTVSYSVTARSPTPGRRVE